LGLVGRPERKRPLGRPKRKGKDFIKMELQEMGLGGMDWIDLTQDGDRLRALVNVLIINQSDASICQIYCLPFKYSSAYFGHPLADYQELINCSSRLWFTVGTWSVRC